ncbi:MAG: helix-turn-helix domain-containing protein [Actinomycetales bacterium]|nr:MAG: helix-turn-helix domain-containing protein [Actinomycetales bacterium]
MPTASRGTTLQSGTRAPSPVGKPESARAPWKIRVISVTSGTFLTVAEVAAQMRVSKMTVYRLVHAGELEAVRVGRSFRVPEGAVEEYLQKSFFQAG